MSLDLAISQIVSATNSVRSVMPPGIQPPLVVQFNASSVPVLQTSLSSDNLNEQQLYDYGIYRLRQQLAPIQGTTLPTPAGGKYRQIMVDIDPEELVARGLTPLDVVNAVNAQNLRLPSGTAKIGDTQYTVRTNATPPSINKLMGIWLKSLRRRSQRHIRERFTVGSRDWLQPARTLRTRLTRPPKATPSRRPLAASTRSAEPSVQPTL